MILGQSKLCLKNETICWTPRRLSWEQFYIQKKQFYIQHNISYKQAPDLARIFHSNIDEVEIMTPSPRTLAISTPSSALTPCRAIQILLPKDKESRCLYLKVNRIEQSHPLYQSLWPCKANRIVTSLSLVKLRQRSISSLRSLHTWQQLKFIWAYFCQLQLTRLCTSLASSISQTLNLLLCLYHCLGEPVPQSLVDSSTEVNQPHTPCQGSPALPLLLGFPTSTHRLSIQSKHVARTYHSKRTQSTFSKG